MAELSKIRKNGVDYDIKDSVARKAIEDLEIPESGVTDEQIASAVEEYMAEHPVSGGEAIDYNKNVRAVAHRGYSTEAPENTIPAYILAKQKGFNYAECDVSFTSDGVAVLLHDGTIDRTSNGSGSISAMTYDEASKYDYGSWKNTKYNGTRIPTFAEFIATCKAIGLYPYIELKSNGSYTEEQIAGIVAAVKAHGMTGKVTYISFNATFLAYVKNADPSARLGYLANNVNSTAIGDAVALKTDSNEVYLGACYDNLNDDGIQLCIEADLPLEIWTVNNTSAIQNMNAYITGVTSDKLIAGKILHDAGMIYEYGIDGEDVHTHSYTSAVTTPATCTTEGVKTFTCSCGNSYTEKIPVIAHNYVNGICSVCGAADPSGGDTDERTPLYSWDLTQSLTDTVGGVVAETNATRDGTGVVFNAPESGGGHYIDFGQVYAPNRTYEIDIAEMNLDTSASPHARLFAVDTDTDTGAGGSGFVFHSGLEKWKFYAYGTGWMNEAMNGDTNVFSGKTVSIKVDADRMASVYIDGVLLLAASRAFPEYPNGHAYIGGSVTDSLYNVTISGFRVYEGASH